nr:Ig-like domain-containing protein [Psychrobacter sp. PraFG1]UNK06295.1 Ig-like domain-containing protein [Psychrobacter sp. PraFG1]
MKTVIVKVNTATQTIAEHTVVTQDGQPTVIKAVQKVNYELFDPATGHAPNHIVTKRIGNDLHVSMEDNAQDSDLIIEGFYDDTNSALIGLAENGEYYYYVPDSGEVVDYVTQLQVGDIEGQALGGESQVAPWWVGATEGSFDTLPWLVGLAGAGIVGAALSSGGGSSSSNGYVPPVDTTAPDAPTVDTVTNTDTDNDGSADTTTITGKAEPDSVITVTDSNGNVIGETTTDKNGNYEIKVPIIADGDKVEITATDKAGNESDPVEAMGDTTAPDAPTATVSPDGTTVTGKTEPGATVEIKDKAGNVIGTATADDKGEYTAELDVPLTNGETITAEATDKAGNGPSTAVNATAPDTTAPDAPTATVSPDGTTVTGKTEPGATVEIKDKAGNVIGTATADDKGEYTAELDVPLTNGETITAEATDKAGNGPSTAVNATAPDTTAPDAPTATVSPDGTTVTGKTEPGATVEIKDKAGNVIGTATADDKGEYTAELDVPLTNGETITAEATDKAGNGPSTAVNATAPDTTAPSKPTLTPGTNDGSVKVDLPADTKAGDTVTVKGTNEAGQPVEAMLTKQPDGTWKSDNDAFLPSTSAANPNSTIIPEAAIKEGTAVSAEAKDSSGNTNGPVTTTAGSDANTAPTAPTVSASNDLEQGQAVAGDVVATASGSTDPDGDDVTYELDTDSQENYAIDPVTGEITLTQAGADKVNAGETLPAPVVNATDGTLDSTSTTGTVPNTVNEVNEAPTAPTVSASNDLEQGQAVAGDVVATASGSTDPDGDDVTYELDTASQENYAIDPVTGEITLTQAGADKVNAGETLPAPVVNATDGTLDSTSTTGTVPNTVNEVNEAPTAPTVSASNDLEQGQAVAGDVVATASGSTDPDGDDVTYELDTASQENYAIDPVTGEITLTQAGADKVNAGETLPAPVVNATDGTLDSTSTTGTVPNTVNEVNEAPTAPTVSASNDLEQGQAVAGDVVATASGSTDPDGDDVTYELDTASQENYAIDPVTGEITLTQAGADKVNAGETLPAPVVNATDGTLDSTSTTGTVPNTVNEVNEAPTAPTVSASNDLEQGQAVAGDVVATASGSTDPDGDDVTYELDTASQENYAIDPVTGEITLTQAGADKVNAGETLPAPVVNATDGTLDSTSTTGTVPNTVNEVNEAPTAPTVSASNDLEQGQAVAGDVVATASGSTDPDGDDVTYELDTASQENYAIDPVTGEITLTQAGADKVNAGETLPAPVVNATDGTLDSTSTTGTVPNTVNEVNEAPTAPTVSASNDLEQGQAVAGDVVATASGSTDPDGDDVTYELDTASQENYAIDPVTGEITLTQAGADKVNAGETLPAPVVNATDGTLDSTSTTGTVPNTVNEVNEAPTAPTVSASNDLEQGQAVAGDVVATASGSTDPDGDDVTYELDTASQENYAIDPVTGEITLTQAGADKVNAGETLPAPVVNATDGTLDSTSTTGTVPNTVNEVNEAPTAPTVSASNDLEQGQAVAGDVVATASGSTDPDGDDVTYELDTASQENYAIDPVTGEITLTQAGADKVNAGETLPAPVVNATDGTLDSTSTTGTVPNTVNEVNEAPTAPTVSASNDLEQGQAVAGDVVATASGSTDPDGDDVTYELDTASQENYAIDPVTGEITLTQAGADKVNAGETLPAPVVNATDGTLDSTSTTGTVPNTVNEVNEAPTAPTVSASNDLEQGQAVAGDVVATASGSTDPDGDDVTYELDTASQENYAIDPVTGEITLTQAGADKVNAGETLPAPVVNATDGTLDSTSTTGTVPNTVNEVNEAPTAPTVSASNDLEQGQAVAGDVVATASGSTDPDGDDVTYELDTASQENYAIDPVTGEITLTQAGADKVNAGETLPAPVVNATDGTLDSTSTTGTVPNTVNEVNEAPTAPTVSASNDLEQGQAVAGDVVATASGSTDPDGDDVTYELDTASQENYAIDPVTGEITLTQAGADKVNAGETLPAPVVNATDGTLDSTSTTGTVPNTVNEVNEAPTAPTVSASNDLEQGQAVAGDVVATASGSTDPDGDDVTYELDTASQENYAIDPVTGEITLTQAGADKVNAGETLPAPVVNATDGTLDSTSTTGTVPNTVNEVNEAPTAPTVSASNDLEQGQAVAGDVVATASGSTDPDGDDVTYELDTASQENYAIDPVTGEITLTQAGADKVNAGETLPAPVVNATDGTLDSTSTTGTVPNTVNEVNEAPTAPTVSASNDLEQGQAVAGDVVATASGSTDPDGDDVTYELDTASQENYAIDPVTGEITLTQAGADKVNAGETLPAPVVNATDGTLDSTSTTGTVPNTVNEVNEAPTAPTVSASNDLEQGQAVAGDVVATASGSTDPDGDDVTYELDTASQENYAIDPVTGEITLTQAGADKVNAGETLPAPVVNATDGTLDSTSTTGTVPNTVNEVNEAPTAPTVSASNDLEQGQAVAGDVVATASGSTDPDGDDVTYELDTASQENYAIDPVTGEITLTQAGADKVNAGETLPAPVVNATDGTLDSTSTTGTVPNTVNEVNEAPTAPTVSASNDLEQGQAVAGDVVATASGSTDPDGDDVTYELDTASQENYAIDPVTGEITLTQAGADKVNAGETLPAPVVNATDGTLDSTSTTGTVPNTVNEVNEAPTAPTVSASNDLEQGQAVAGDVVATASGSTDPDGDDVTYELDTASQENYAIDPVTGEITLTQAGADKVNAGETLPAPVVNATDGTLDSTSTTGTVPNTVNEVNEAPTAPTVSASNDLEQGQAVAGDVVATASGSTDPDGDDVTYELDTASQENYAIDPVTGEITLTQAGADKVNAGETLPAPVVNATDGTLDSTSTTGTVPNTVNEVNEAPTAPTVSASNDLEQGQAVAGDVVATASGSTDPDGDDVTYELDTASQENYAIDPVTGEITLTQAGADKVNAGETLPAPVVNATDGTLDSTSTTGTVPNTVNEVNEAPTAPTVSASNDLEQGQAVAGDVVATASGSTDPDGDDVTYELDTASQENYAIDPVTGEITLTQAGADKVNAGETLPAPVVNATDGTLDSTSTTGTVPNTVNEVNEAPTAPTVSASNDLEQGQAVAGDVVATASGSTDPDGDDVTYELDTASQENYAIDPVTGEITLTQAGADKVNAGETLPAPVVNATDGTLDSTSTTGTVPNTVNEVNEAPTAPTVSASNDLEQGQAVAGDVVATASGSTDPDGDDVTYELDTASQENYAIDPVTGEITLTQAGADKVNAGETLPAPVVNATDGTLDSTSTTGTVPNTVNEVNEAPTAPTVSASNDLEQGQAVAGDVVATASGSTDPDGDDVTYELDTASQENYAIDPVTGEITLTQAGADKVNAGETLPAPVVNATDGTLDSTSTTGTVPNTVNEVNEAPTAPTVSASNDLEQGQAVAGDVVATASGSTDPDGDDVTYELDTASQENYAIDPVTGEITLTQAGADKVNAGETLPAPVVNATDGTLDSTSTTGTVPNTVNEVNEAPTAPTVSASNDLEQGQAVAGDVVATASGSTDPDGDDVTYELDTASQENYAIDPVTGEITLTQAGADKVNAGETLPAPVVNATDGTLDSTSTTGTVPNTVNEVNEAPTAPTVSASNDLEQGQAVAGDVVATASGSTDPDGDDVTYELDTASQENYAIDPVTGEITLTQAGADKVNAGETLPAPVVNATDGTLDSTSTTGTVPNTVNEVNEAPTAPTVSASNDLEQGQAVAGDVVATASGSTDPDGDDVTYELDTASQENYAIDPVTGEITLTQAGADKVNAGETLPAPVVNATDGTLDSTSTTGTVPNTVNEVNEAPTAPTVSASNDLEQGQAVAGDVVATASGSTDPDGDDVTYELDTASQENYAIDPVTGEITLTQAGADKVNAGETLPAPVVNATDGTLDSTSTTGTVPNTVNEVNEAPTAPTVSASNDLEQGQAVAGDVVATASGSTDPDGDDVTYELDTASQENYAIDPVTGEITLTQAGADKVNAGETLPAPVVNATDGTLDSTSTTGTVPNTVNEVNEAPTAPTVSASNDLEQGQAVAGDVVATASGSTDPDGDDVTYELDTASQENYAIDPVTGEITLTQAGADKVNAGETLPAPVVNATDGTLDSTSTTGTVPNTVNEVNEAPTAPTVSASNDLEQGQAVAGDVVATASGSTDPDGDDVTYELDTASQENYAIDPVTGEITLTQAGADKVNAGETLPAPVVNATDGTLDSTSTTGTVPNTVNEVNEAPTAPTVSASNDLEQGQAVAGDVVATASGSTDPDGDDVTYELDTASQENYAIDPVTGEITLTQAGADKVNAGETLPAPVVNATDGTLDSTSTTGTVPNTVNEVNEAPTAPTVSASNDLEQGQAVAGDVVATASGSTDPDGDDVTYELDTASQENYAIDPVTGEITLTQAGADKVNAGETLPAPVVNATDGTLDSTSTTGTVPNTVNEVNEAPTAPTVSASNDLEQGQAVAGDVVATASGSTDPDGDDVTYELDTASQENYAIDPVTGEITLTQAGADKVNAGETLPAPVVNATDGTLDSTSTTGTVPNTVNEVNEAPTAPTVSASNDLEQGQAVAGDVVATASGSTDPDGDDVTYELDAASQENYAIDPVTGEITLTQAGADKVNAGETLPAPVVNATDGTLDSTSTTGTVPNTVNEVNEAPTASNTTITATEDTDATGSLPEASDVDGDAVTYAAGTTAPVNGSVTIGSDGTYTYTPNANFNGTDSFSYIVNDGNGGTNEYTVDVTVEAVNDAPTASNTTITATEDTDATGSLPEASDVDGDAITYAAGTTVPANGSVTIGSDGTYTYTPNANFNGTDSFSYIVNDGNGGTNEYTVDVTVEAVNDAPTASNTTITATEDTDATGSLPEASDVDGDAITYAAGTTVPANGSVTIGSDGTYTYTPNANFNGTDSFSYIVNDGNGGTNEYTVDVTVEAVNDAPTASNTTITATEDTDATGSLPEASDVDGDAITYAAGTTAPANGSVTIGSDGTYTYTPNANFNGTDSFSYIVNDGNGGTNEYTVDVTVEAVNDAPTASNTTITATEDTDATGSLPEASDVDGDAITYAAGTTVPANGSVTIGSDGTYTYTPNANFNGTDSFSYIVNDGNGGTNEYTVDVTVEAVNDAPTASNTTITATEDTDATGSLPEASDVDGDAITYAAGTTVPANGSVTIGSDGTYTYTPNANFNGTDSFSYIVNDGNGGTNEYTVDVTVEAVNDAPTASNTTITATEDTDATGSLPEASDVDGDAITYAAGTTVPANGSVTIGSDGTYTYTPNANFNGTDSFSYIVNDGNGGTNEYTVDVTVEAVNDAPTASNTTITATEDTDATGSLPEASDVDGDAITYAAGTTVPANGSVTIGSDGTYTYTPNANFNGTDSFSYIVNDGNGGTNEYTVDVTVEAVNDAPTASNTTITATEDTDATGSLPEASDVDGDAITYAAGTTVPANGSVTIGSDGTYTYTPNANFNGTDSFSYIVNDGNGGTNEYTVDVTVEAVNDAPTASNTTITATEDTDATGSLPEASDVDGDAITYAAGTTAPVNGSVTIGSDGTYTYTPNANFNGTDSFSYIVNDGNGGTNEYTVDVTVEAVNDAPTASNTTITATEDTDATGSLPEASDVDGDAITYAAGTTVPANGSVTIGSDGTYTYTPNANFNGTDSFSYIVNDGNGGTNEYTVDVTVEAVNDAPTASNTTITATEDTDATGSLPEASDVDGDAITYAAGTTVPANGSVTIGSDGTYTYTPNANFNGTDSFSYIVNDGNGGTNEYTVDVTVEAVNDAPTASNTTITATEDTDATGSLPEASDVDGDAITYAAGTTAPANGSVTIGSDGTYTYTPNANFNGTDSFSYIVNDGNGGTNEYTVDVTVEAVNDAPTASNTTITATEDTDATGSLPEASDVDGDAITYAAGTTAPANGSVTIGSDGTYTYTPNANFNGTDSFSYIVNDGNGGTNEYTVDVTVEAVNDAPTASNTTITATEDTDATGSLPEASDVDGDAITYAAGTTVPANGSVTIGSDGTYTYTPNANFNGTDSFSYIVNDGNGGTNEYTVDVTVEAVNDAPTASNTTITATEDTDATGSLPEASDVDGDAITYAAGTTVPANGSVTIGSDGTYTYTPNANFNGTDSFSYIVNDGNGGTNEYTVDVTVEAVNDAPTASNTTITATEDTDATGSLPEASDVDGDAITYAAGTTVPANGSVTIGSDGTYTYTPNANFNGTDSFSYIVNDGNGGTNEYTVDVTVEAVNDAPTASNTTITATEDTDATGSLPEASDVDGDAITYAAGTTVPANGSVTIGSDGTYTYTPNANFNGTDSFSYIVNDGNGGTNEYTVDVTVEAVNDAPTASNTTITATEDTDATGSLPEASDVDGDAITYAAGTTVPANGSVTIGSDGTYTYTPNANFNGTDSFSYIVNDGNGGTNEYTVDVTVEAVNDAPTASNTTITATEDTDATGSLPEASDVDGDAITYAAGTTVPANGSVTIGSDGTYTYTPNANFNGTDSFSYIVNDGNGGTNEYTVDVTVEAVNDAPTASNTTITATEDTDATGSLPEASDVDGDAITYAAGTTVPANGSVTIGSDGTYTYTPNANFNGTDSFSYIVNDGNGGTNEYTVDVTVEAVNDAPTASNTTITATEDTDATGSLPEASDVDGDAVTYAAGTTAPVNGSVTIGSDGTYTYTPNANFNGTDSFSYIVNDGNGGTNEYTVDVTVEAVNDAPTLEVPEKVSIYQGYVDTSMTIANVNGSDVDEGDVLTYSLPEDTNGYFAIDNTGKVTLTDEGVDYINTGNISNQKIELKVMVSDNSDASNNSTMQTITLPVILATKVVFVEVTDDSNEEVEDLPANQTSAYGVDGVYTGIVANNRDGSVQTDPAVLQGLTNDTTPTITVTLEKPLRTATSDNVDEAETVQVVLTPTQGKPFTLYMSDAQVSADGMTYTWSDFTLAQTQALGNDYRVDAQVVAGTVKPTLSTAFTLDTLAGRPEIVINEDSFNVTSDDDSQLARITGKAEALGTVFLDFNDNGVLDADEVSTKVDANGNWSIEVSLLKGRLDLDTDGVDKTKGAGGLDAEGNVDVKDLVTKFSFVDKAGNALKADFAELYYFDRSESGLGGTYNYRDEPQGAITYTGNNKKWVAADGTLYDTQTNNTLRSDVIVYEDNGSDKIIISTEHVNSSGAIYGFATFTGSGNDYFTLGGRQSSGTRIFMEDGDDTYEALRVRGYGDADSIIINMGLGDDKVNILRFVKDTTIDLGEGDNTLNIGSTLRGNSVISSGSGNDNITIREGIDIFDAQDGLLLPYRYDNKIFINAGNGNNVINIGEKDENGNIIATGHVEATESGQRAHIITGKDDDVINVTGNIDGKNASIESGQGNDEIEVGIIQRQAKVITGADTLTPGATDDDTLTAVALNNSSTVKTGAGNDTVTIKTDIGNGAGTPTLDLGSGNDTLIVGDATQSNGRIISGNITTGSGDDKAYIYGNMTGGTLNMGSGIDHLQVNQVRGNSTIDMGEGNDTVNMERLGQTLASTGTPELRLGAGADNLDLGVLRIGNIYSGNDTDQDIININTMEAGYVELGNTDILNISNLESGTIKSSQGGNDVSISGSMTGGTIDLGTARDDVSIANKSAGKVFLGDGNDTIDVTTHSGGDIDTGAGNDTVTIDTMSGGNIYLASGNDTISINTFTGGTLNGGAGTDTLHITGSGNNINASSISAFEVLDLGTGDSGNTFTASRSTVYSNSLSGMYIKGDASDTVTLTSTNNWQRGSEVTDSEGNSYFEYSNTYLGDRVLYVDTDITVTGNIVL